MQIRSLETFLIPPRWCFLKITTDSGLAGWGEPVVEGKAATVAAAVEEMSDFLIGRDATRIEDLWQVLYRGGFYRGGPVLMSAISGIDQALWDIRGKALGVPVYDLLGGAVREKIRVYAWIGGDRPDDVATEAKSAKRAGRISASRSISTGASTKAPPKRSCASSRKFARSSSKSPSSPKIMRRC